MKSTLTYISPEQEQIDKAICDLSYKCNLMRGIRPINAVEECEKFLANQGNYNPQFTYKVRDIQKIQHTVDTLLGLQKDFTANDPISLLQAKKIQELIEKYSLMIAYQEQNLESIYKYNTRLFESIPRDEQIPIPQHSPQIQISDYLGTDRYDHIAKIDIQQAQELVKMKCQQLGIENYKIILKRLGSEYMSINFQDPIHIQINTKDTFDAKIFIALLRHELDGHVIRYLNGSESGIHILKEGTAYHKATEEGIATYYQSTVSGIGTRYDNASIMREKCKQGMGKDRIQLCAWIKENRKVNLEQAFWMTLRVKQGIQNTSIIHPGTICQSDRVYLEGRHLIDQYIDAHGSIDKLMVGKIGVDDISIIG